MALFRFFLIGTSQAPILEVDQDDLRELHEALAHRRFVEGRMTEIDGYNVACDVLIPINRIQMICEITL